MADWLPLDHDLPDKPEFIAIVEATGESVETVFFRWFLFWRLMDRHTTDGRYRNVQAKGLASRLGGTAEYWETIARVTKSAENPMGWLHFDGSDTVMPHYEKWFTNSSKRRIADAKRKKADARAVKTRKNTPQNLRSGAEKNSANTPQPCGVSGGANAEVLPSPQPQPQPQPDGEERRGEDHLHTLSKKDACASEEAVAAALRKFRPLGGGLINKHFRAQDRLTLLKLGSLMVTGQIPEAWIDSGLQALSLRRNTSEEPVTRPVGYLMTVIKAEASKAGVNLHQLLAATRIALPETEDLHDRS
jgi:hypothetical protein